MCILENSTTRERIVILEDQSGRFCVESQEMSKVINEYFSPVLPVDMITGELGGGGNGDVEIVCIIVEEVLNILKCKR